MGRIATNIKNLRIFKVVKNENNNYEYINIMENDESLKKSAGKITVQFDDNNNFTTKSNGLILKSQEVQKSGGSFTLEMAKFPSQETLNKLYNMKRTKSSSLYANGKNNNSILCIQFDIIEDGCDFTSIPSRRVRIPYCIPNFINIQPKAMSGGSPANNSFLIDGSFNTPLDPTWRTHAIEFTDLTNDDDYSVSWNILGLHKYQGPRMLNAVISQGSAFDSNSYTITFVNWASIFKKNPHTKFVIEVYNQKERIYQLTTDDSDITAPSKQVFTATASHPSFSSGKWQKEMYCKVLPIYDNVAGSPKPSDDDWWNGLGNDGRQTLLYLKPIFVYNIQDWLKNNQYT